MAAAVGVKLLGSVEPFPFLQLLQVQVIYLTMYICQLRSFQLLLSACSVQVTESAMQVGTGRCARTGHHSVVAVQLMSLYSTSYPALPTSGISA